MTRTVFTLAVMIPVFSTMIFAQQPAATTPQQTSVALESKNITVTYSGPSMNGRKIFGGVVPYGQVWRIGETVPAELHTDTTLVFKGLTVPKGDYTLYILVNADNWQLIINKQTGQKAVNYDPKMDVGRVAMTLTKAPAPVETCKLTLSKTTALGAKLQLTWENSIASVPLYLDRVAGAKEW